MKWRTNRERRERKMKKAIEMRESNKKQVHVSYHNKPGYHAIAGAVRTKTSHIVIKKAHPGRGIEKQVLMPRVLWVDGTYEFSKHGELGIAN